MCNNPQKKPRVKNEIVNVTSATHILRIVSFSGAETTPGIFAYVPTGNPTGVLLWFLDTFAVFDEQEHHDVPTTISTHDDL